MDRVLEPLVQIQKDLSPPNGADFWTSPQEVGSPPLFTTREVAFIFFGRKRVWFERLFLDKKVVLDGEEIDIPRTQFGYRQFQLHHVELVAHAFIAQGIIDLRTFRNCISAIKAIADNYRLI